LRDFWDEFGFFGNCRFEFLEIFFVWKFLFGLIVIFGFCGMGEFGEQFVVEWDCFGKLICKW